MSLDIFVPTPRKITVAGRDFEILPLRMKQVPGFAAAIRPVQALLLAGQLTQASEDHFEQIIKAVCIATGADEDWLAELFPHDFLALADLVFEVNVDFFARHVLPKLSVAATRVTEITRTSKPNSAGEPGSPG